MATVVKHFALAVSVWVPDLRFQVMQLMKSWVFFLKKIGLFFHLVSLTFSETACCNLSTS